MNRQVVRFAGAKKAVHSGDPVMVAVTLATGVDDAEGRGGTHIATVAEDTAGHRLFQQRGVAALVRREEQAVDGIFGRKDTEAVAARLAGELDPPIGIDDGASENDAVGDVECRDTLEKERAPLFEEECKALVDVELGDVGLDLREVGVDRADQRQARGDSPARGQTDLGVLFGFPEVIVGRLVELVGG
jgi:hypothetical protein